MTRWLRVSSLAVFILVAFPSRSPAPLTFRPGEGWTYEPVGGEGQWQRTRAKEQLEVAQAAFDKKDNGLALKAAHRVVRQWPRSDYAAPAQYLIGRCYEAKGQDEKAFQEYQHVLENYPKIDNYQEVLQRQFEIANRFLAGQWFKLWDYIPFFPSMTRTAEMYDKIIKNGPYSDVAPQAQLKIGSAKVKQSNFPEAVKAYELAADRYHDQPQIAANALYGAGMAHYRQTKTAEYDQSSTGKAIAAFTDFMTIYPGDVRVAEAKKIIAELKREQARGSFQIAEYYERNRRWNGALIYYNEVLLQDPNSPHAATAREKIDELKKRVALASQ